MGQKFARFFTNVNLVVDIDYRKSYTNSIMQLYKRDIFDIVKPYLGDETVLVLIGARQVGKTHILRYIQKYLD